MEHEGCWAAWLAWLASDMVAGGSLIRTDAVGVLRLYATFRTIGLFGVQFDWRRIKRFTLVRQRSRYQGVKTRSISLGWEFREGDDERRSAERAAPSAYASEGTGVIRLDERRYSMNVSFSQTQSTTLRVIHASPRLATTTRASRKKPLGSPRARLCCAQAPRTPSPKGGTQGCKWRTDAWLVEKASIGRVYVRLLGIQRRGSLNHHSLLPEPCKARPDSFAYKVSALRARWGTPTVQLPSLRAFMLDTPLSLGYSMQSQYLPQSDPDLVYAAVSHYHPHQRPQQLQQHHPHRHEQDHQTFLPHSNYISNMASKDAMQQYPDVDAKQQPSMLDVNGFMHYSFDMNAASDGGHVNGIDVAAPQLNNEYAALEDLCQTHVQTHRDHTHDTFHIPSSSTSPSSLSMAMAAAVAASPTQTQASTPSLILDTCSDTSTSPPFDPFPFDSVCDTPVPSTSNTASISRPPFYVTQQHPRNRNSNITNVQGHSGTSRLSSPSARSSSNTRSSPRSSPRAHAHVSHPYLNAGPSSSSSPGPYSRRGSEKAMSIAISDAAAASGASGSGASPSTGYVGATSAVATTVGGRLPGACARCKKLKMKCIFPDAQPACVRCNVGGHHCVVEGRKARTPSHLGSMETAFVPRGSDPGALDLADVDALSFPSAPAQLSTRNANRIALFSQREHLLRQIREKDQSIADILSRLHTCAPGSSSSSGASGSYVTPLSILPARLGNLTPAERQAHSEVLARMEKHQASARAWEVARGAIDVGALEVDEEMDDDELEDDGEDDDERDEDESQRSKSESMDVDLCKKEQGAETQIMRRHTSHRRGGDGEGGGGALRLHSLPDSTAPLGFLASCSLKYGKGRHPTLNVPSNLAPNANADAWSQAFGGLKGVPEMDFGIANGAYFSPGPSADLNLRQIVIEREMLPEILISGLISPDEAKALFDIFFHKMNDEDFDARSQPFLSILDETIHTPASVLRRCPFLFTAICAVASRYYTQRPEIYKMAMHFAKAAAASAFIDGWKCVEMSQAYLIMAAYGSPTRTWEEDRGSFYTGVASRLAVELNLNKPSNEPPADERHERELLNRRRTWMICCIMDYSTSMQMGKQPTIREDEIIRNSSRWCSASTFQHPFDAHLPAIIELLRIMNAFIDTTSEVQSYPADKRAKALATVIDAFTQRLSSSSLEKAAMRGNLHEEIEMADQLRTGMVAYLLEYCRLIVISYGLQSEIASKALKAEGKSRYLEQSINAAFALVDAWLKRMVATQFVKYAPEFFFVGTGFAGAFLVKLLHPRFAHVVSEEQRAKIFAVSSLLISTLASDEIAIDAQHTPRHYSAFLDGVLKNMMSLWQDLDSTEAQRDVSAESLLTFA
ncbi:hypothetical protein HETIRDRAFT_445608 [Heterobasidion irregulare TC 32-1]|uniref:Zn(2)-C6 fungal-type domain-containing protein n=1 Tax=Heterobasidion irregulare (strain TC 32-1) TaxID=747525 RepID=W4K413_HETIT|nr:uncharacterized protein HETIRDRAFT_445608 [Heterobasidion irregulare TC 32-1]ETW80085.1 hypothetical protein HETIRDRAFT_445608 [Heterobasidion irregulare TC 32-1]